MHNRIKELYQLIRKYDAAYYSNGQSLISDREYDALYQELVTLEKEYPQFSEPDSPTKRVGDDLIDAFTKVEHSIPMMSIENTYSSGDLREWVNRLEKILEAQPITYIGELKVDGVACALRYNKGKLVQAITRGNGTTGDDITVNVRTIKSVPLTVDYREPFEIRGEIYMTFLSFNTLNQLLIENGEEPMQNPRNTTSGTMKQLNPAEVAKRKLSFFAHFLLSENHQQSHYDNLCFLEKLGFATVSHSTPLNNYDDVKNFIDRWQDERSALGFPVDGVVVKVNSIALQRQAGATAKAPRWVIAYKYQPETAITEVLGIDPQIGRTGVLTPVARLKPVSLSGTTVRNATLHNYDEITRLDITIGDCVEVEKSGEIIPKITKVISRDKRSDTIACKPPTVCPSCGSQVIRMSGEVAVRCVNTSCPAQILASLNHFVSREAMNIEGLGPALVEQLIEKKVIVGIADLFTVSVQTLAELDRMGDKSAANIVGAITKAKQNPLHRLIHGLGIRMVGAQTAKVLAGRVMDLIDLQTMTAEDLTAIETIGPNMAASIRFWFDQQKNIELINALRVAGVNCQGTRQELSLEAQPLRGKTFVLTGTLNNFTRDEAQEKIEALGGTVSSSVSKKTYAVIAGQEAGAKLQKAKDIGVRIMEEAEFIKMIDLRMVE